MTARSFVGFHAKLALASLILFASSALPPLHANAIVIRTVLTKPVSVDEPVRTKREQEDEFLFDEDLGKELEPVVVDDEPVEKEPEQQDTNGQAPQQSSNKEPADQESSSQEPVQQHEPYKQPENPKTVHHESVQLQPLNEKPANQEPFNQEPIPQKPLNKVPGYHEPNNQGPVQQHAFSQEPANQKPFNGEPVAPALYEKGKEPQNPNLIQQIQLEPLSQNVQQNQNAEQPRQNAQQVEQQAQSQNQAPSGSPLNVQHSPNIIHNQNVQELPNVQAHEHKVSNYVQNAFHAESVQESRIVEQFQNKPEPLNNEHQFDDIKPQSAPNYSNFHQTNSVYETQNDQQSQNHAQSHNMQSFNRPQTVNEPQHKQIQNDQQLQNVEQNSLPQPPNLSLQNGRVENFQPQFVQPENSQLQKVQPLTVQPQYVQQEIAQLENILPLNVQPQNVQPENVQHQNVQSHNVQPLNVQPQFVPSGNDHLQIVQPQNVQPQNVQTQNVVQNAIALPQNVLPLIVQQQDVQPELGLRTYNEQQPQLVHQTQNDQNIQFSQQPQQVQQQVQQAQNNEHNILAQSPHSLVTAYQHNQTPQHVQQNIEKPRIQLQNEQYRNFQENQQNIEHNRQPQASNIQNTIHQPQNIQNIIDQTQERQQYVSDSIHKTQDVLVQDIIQGSQTVPNHQHVVNPQVPNQIFKDVIQQSGTQPIANVVQLMEPDKNIEYQVLNSAAIQPNVLQAPLQGGAPVPAEPGNQVDPMPSLSWLWASVQPDLLVHNKPEAATEPTVQNIQTAQPGLDVHQEKKIPVENLEKFSYQQIPNAQQIPVIENNLAHNDFVVQEHPSSHISPVVQNNLAQNNFVVQEQTPVVQNNFAHNDFVVQDHQLGHLTPVVKNEALPYESQLIKQNPNQILHSHLVQSEDFILQHDPNVHQESVVEENPVQNTYVQQIGNIKQEPEVQQFPVIHVEPAAMQKLIHQTQVVQQEPSVQYEPNIKQEPIVQQEPVSQHVPFVHHEPVSPHEPVFQKEILVQQEQVFQQDQIIQNTQNVQQFPSVQQNPDAPPAQNTQVNPGVQQAQYAQTINVPVEPAVQHAYNVQHEHVVEPLTNVQQNHGIQQAHSMQQPTFVQPPVIVQQVPNVPQSPVDQVTQVQQGDQFEAISGGESRVYAEVVGPERPEIKPFRPEAEVRLPDQQLQPEGKLLVNQQDNTPDTAQKPEGVILDTSVLEHMMGVKNPSTLTNGLETESGQSQPPTVFAPGLPIQLAMDMSELMSLLPAHRFVPLLLDYLARDNGVTKLIEFAKTPSARQLLTNLDRTPQFQQLVIYLHEKGFPAVQFVNVLHTLVGVPGIPTPPGMPPLTGGVRGLATDALALVPTEEFDQLLDQKMRTNPELKEIVDTVRDNLIPRIIGQLSDTPEYKELQSIANLGGLLFF